MFDDENIRLNRRNAIKMVPLGLASGSVFSLLSEDASATSDDDLRKELEIDPDRPTPASYQIRLKLKARKSMFKHIQERTSQTGGV